MAAPGASMRDNQRFLALLLAIFLSLAAVLILQSNAPSSDSENRGMNSQPTPQLRRIFPDLAVLDILALRVEDRITGEIFTMARDTDGSWLARSIDQETTLPLREDAGTLLARSVVLLGYTQTITLSPERDLSEFGFQPDAQIYIYIITVDNQQHVVAVGNPLQTGPYYYIIVDDRPEIYIVDRAAVDSLAVTLDTPPFAAP